MMSNARQEDDVIRSIADKHAKAYAAVRLMCGLPDYAAALRRLDNTDIDEEQPEHMHITAAQFCEAVKTYSFDFYGDDAPSILAQWGISTSEDIGVIVYELVRVGYIMVSDSDQPEDFYGLKIF